MAQYQPLVTALINTFNYGRFLPFAINSVLNQTYPRIEIVVVDDGSTDHTADVFAQYADRIRAIRTENGGQAHAFNVGISAARGELVMLLDADDMWLPEKVERMVDLAEKRPKAALLYHRFQNMLRNGQKVGDPGPIPLINGNYASGFLRSGGSWWVPIASVQTLRTDHVRRALPFPTYAVREGADAMVADYCALTTELASLPEALTLRLLHGSNFYAAGRDGHEYRSRAVRESDIRRIDWRLFSLQQLMKRFGREIKLDVKRHEWRVTNLYWIGHASFWSVLRACMLGPEHNLRHRWDRLKWVVGLKKQYRDELGRRRRLNPFNNNWKRVG